MRFSFSLITFTRWWTSSPQDRLLVTWFRCVHSVQCGVKIFFCSLPLNMLLLWKLQISFYLWRLFISTFFSLKRRFHATTEQTSAELNSSAPCRTLRFWFTNRRSTTGSSASDTQTTEHNKHHDTQTMAPKHSKTKTTTQTQHILWHTYCNTYTTHKQKATNTSTTSTYTTMQLTSTARNTHNTKITTHKHWNTELHKYFNTLFNTNKHSAVHKNNVTRRKIDLLLAGIVSHWLVFILVQRSACPPPERSQVQFQHLTQNRTTLKSTEETSSLWTEGNTENTVL